MRIALDAMGTDAAPDTEVAGAVAAVEEDPELELVLVGDRTLIGRSLDGGGHDRISVVHTPDRVSHADAPLAALRRTPRSSISLGIGLQKSGRAEAFVSAGSTGAVMAASQLILRSLSGVDRPTIGTLFPTARGATLVVDSGANVDCKPAQLAQFARLGAVYMQDVAGIRRPTIGLLNVGSEARKGTEAVQAAHRLLEASDLEFVGNVEGREVIRHRCDVLVCDGFIGNILLKFYESVAGFVVDTLSARTGDPEVAALLRAQLHGFDYAEYGGVPLLGVNGVSVICHGASSPRAIRKAVGVAKRAVANGMVSHMERDLAALGVRG